MKSRIIVHPLLMAVFPALFIFVNNIREVSPGELTLPLTVSIGLSLVLWGALALALRDTKDLRTSALLTTLSLGLFSGYGHVARLVDGAAWGGFVIGRNKFLLPACALLFAAGVYGILRVRKTGSLGGWTLRAHVFTGLLIAGSLFQVGGYEIHRRVTGVDGAVPAPGQASGSSSGREDAEEPVLTGTGAGPSEEPSMGGADTGAKPDIYYIIPDSYEASSSLSEVFGLDNSPFTRHLESKGFFIAAKSRSNYAFTTLSLASSLNMQHVTFLTQRMGETSSDESIADGMMADNRVMRFFKERGYKIINAGSWWGPTYMNQNADLNLRSSRLNDFTLKLLQGTLLSPFMRSSPEVTCGRRCCSRSGTSRKFPRCRSRPSLWRM